MDLFNNRIGVSKARDGKSVADCYRSCAAAAAAYSLYWFEQSNPAHPFEIEKVYPAFTINPNGSHIRGEIGSTSPEAPVLGPLWGF